VYLSKAQYDLTVGYSKVLGLMKIGRIFTRFHMDRLEPVLLSRISTESRIITDIY